MAIQLINAGIRPVRQTGAARANPAELSNSGKQAELAGIGQFGEGLQIFSVGMRKAANRMEISTAERKRDERLYAALDEIDKAEMSEDAAGWQKTADDILKKAEDDIASYSPKDSETAAAYEMSNNDRVPFFKHSLTRSAKARYDEKLRGDININLDAAVKRGDYESAGMVVADAVEAGLYTKEQGTAVLEKAKYEVNKNLVWNQAMEMGAAGPEFLSDPKKAKDLTPEDRVAMARSLTFFTDQKAAVETKQLAATQESERLEIVKSLAAGKLDWNFIEQTSLPAAEKNQWREKAESYAGKDPIKFSDPAVVADITKRIALGQDITKSELAGKIGKDLTVADFEKYSGMIDSKEKSDPHKLLRINRAIQTVQSAITAGKFEFYDKKGTLTADGREMLGSRTKQIELFYQINPNPTEAQEAAFTKLLTQDVWTQYYNDVLDRKEYDNLNQQIWDMVGQKPENDITSFIAEDTQEYQQGQQMTKNGVVYTYVGNGKWEY